MNRLNIKLTEKGADELALLKGHLGGIGYKELLARAFRILQWAYRQAQNGRDIVALDRENKQCEPLPQDLIE